MSEQPPDGRGARDATGAIGAIGANDLWRRAGAVDWRAAALVVALVAVLAAGAAWWHRSVGATAATSSLATDPARPIVYATTTVTRSDLVVDVVGAVMHPGVVRLPPGARVVDAIDAAGGPRADADVEQVDLAAKVSDGARVDVPRRGEHVAPAPGNATSSPTDAVPTGPIDLNTATEAQLESLPGIGPSLAQAILAERDRRGGFRSVQDLADVHGIGPRRLAELTPLVTV